MISIKKITKKDRALFLAYDQGLEHGPVEFSDENVDPLKIIDIARKGKFTAMIFQKGIADKYKSEIKKSKVPLIIKLNGKTNLVKEEPMSEQLCTVKEAIKLGAVAVGYTIYIGSKYESKMLKEFENIERDAHKAGIPVIAWVYPGKKEIPGKTEDEVMAYAARIALEIGADIAKIKYTGNPDALKWAVKSAGRCRLVLSGGAKTTDLQILQEAKDAVNAGAMGLAIGRNIWQNENPLYIAKKVRSIIIE